jgi:membrane-associated phospholipid phosphatase
MSLSRTVLSFVVILAVCLVSVPVLGEDEPLQERRQRSMPSLVDLPKDVWHDVRDITTLPRRMNKREWIRAGIGATAIGLLAVHDEEIRDNALKMSDDFYDDFKILGEAGYAAGLFLVGHLAGRAAENEHLAETGAAGLEALTLTAIPTLLVQQISGRERPDDGGGYEWFSGGHGASGHAAVAWCTVTVLDRRYLTVREDMPEFDKFLYRSGKFLLYGAAACAAIERINDDKHFASDVALGSSFGFLCANFVMNRRAPEIQVGFNGAEATIAFTREF